MEKLLLVINAHPSDVMSIAFACRIFRSRSLEKEMLMFSYGQRIFQS